MITTTRSRALLLGLVVAASTAGCNKTEIKNTNQPVNANTANMASSANASSPAADLGKYSLATPSDTYRTAFDARKNCDISVLKRVMSEAMTATLVQRGENDPQGKTTLDETLKKLCEMPQAPNGGIKDEKIFEDQATIKYQDEHGDWQLMDFVRENGEWKLTMPRGKGRLPALK